MSKYLSKEGKAGLIIAGIGVFYFTLGPDIGDFILLEGRVLGSVLMAFGLGMFYYFTPTVAELRDKDDDDDEF